MRCRMHESSTRNESASLSKNISSSVSSVLHSLENLRLKNCELAVSVEMVVWKTSPPTLRKTLSLVPSDRARFLWDDMRRREIRAPARHHSAQLLAEGPRRPPTNGFEKNTARNTRLASSVDALASWPRPRGFHVESHLSCCARCPSSRLSHCWSPSS